MDEIELKETRYDWQADVKILGKRFSLTGHSLKCVPVENFAGKAKRIKSLINAEVRKMLKKKYPGGLEVRSVTFREV